jgi:hypothetical protein
VAEINFLTADTVSGAEERLTISTQTLSPVNETHVYSVLLENWLGLSVPHPPLWPSDPLTL